MTSRFPETTGQDFDSLDDGGFTIRQNHPPSPNTYYWRAKIRYVSLARKSSRLISSTATNPVSGWSLDALTSLRVRSAIHSLLDNEPNLIVPTRRSQCLYDKQLELFSNTTNSAKDFKASPACLYQGQDRPATSGLADPAQQAPLPPFNQNMPPSSRKAPMK